MLHVYTFHQCKRGRRCCSRQNLQVFVGASCALKRVTYFGSKRQQSCLELLSTIIFNVHRIISLLTVNSYVNSQFLVKVFFIELLSGCSKCMGTVFSAQYKFILKWFFVPHILILIFMWAKVTNKISVHFVFSAAIGCCPCGAVVCQVNAYQRKKAGHFQVGSEVLRREFGWRSAFFERLDMPSAYPWEYMWCFSFIPIICAMMSFSKNKVSTRRLCFFLRATITIELLR